MSRQKTVSVPTTTQPAMPGQEQTVFPMPMQAVRSKRPGHLRMSIDVDRTGSSGAYVAAIGQIAGDALHAAQSVVQSVVVDVSSHGDLDLDEMPMHLLAGGTPEEAMRAIASIAIGGGGDAEESHLDALSFVLDHTAWSADPLARNVMICFDTDDTKPHRGGKSAEQLGREIFDRRIKLVLVCQCTPTLKALVTAANGQLIEISRTPTAEDVHRVVSVLTKTLTVVANSGKTVPMPVQ